ncbi:hypothetical protein [Nostoc sp. 'Peltigera membranacea cyanobiont' 210A]|nr:hypothetical protein [Nostoc sp. 'Peltigera membranacea cyanobiont' 210A]
MKSKLNNGKRKIRQMLPRVNVLPLVENTFTPYEQTLVIVMAQ